MDQPINIAEILQAAQSGSLSEGQLRILNTALAQEGITPDDAMALNPEQDQQQLQRLSLRYENEQRFQTQMMENQQTTLQAQPNPQPKPQNDSQQRHDKNQKRDIDVLQGQGLAQVETSLPWHAKAKGVVSTLKPLMRVGAALVNEADKTAASAVGKIPELRPFTDR